MNRRGVYRKEEAVSMNQGVNGAIGERLRKTQRDSDEWERADG